MALTLNIILTAYCCTAKFVHLKKLLKSWKNYSSFVCSQLLHSA